MSGGRNRIPVAMGDEILVFALYFRDFDHGAVDFLEAALVAPQ